MADIYENDLRAASKITDAVAHLAASAAGLKNYYINSAVFELWNGDGYAVGKVIYEDEQARFEVHADKAEEDK